MTIHKSVRLLIRDTAKSLGDNIQFVYARKTDFNQIRDKKYPFIHLEPLNSVGGFIENSHGFNIDFPIAVIFYQLDAVDGAEDQSTEILDQTDELMQSFIRKINLFSLTDDDTVTVSSKNIVISNVSMNNFVKMTADVLTGWILKFNLQVQDDFDYCELYE